MVELAVMLAVFAGSVIVGYLLISRVPQLLHTPLMSMTNAISAITILGALLIFNTKPSVHEAIIGGLAIVTATFNVLGGFVITGRMLRLFRRRQRPE